MRLTNSERKVMQVLWSEGDTTAKRIAEILATTTGWCKTTTYTIIKKCSEKRAIERVEPNWLCRPLVSKKEAQQFAITDLADKMFDGSTDQLVKFIKEMKD